MKLMMKFFLCLHNFSALSSGLPTRNCLWGYFRKLFIALAFRKYEIDFDILTNLFSYKSFVHEKLKLLDILSDFVLIFQALVTS